MSAESEVASCDRPVLARPDKDLNAAPRPPNENEPSAEPVVAVGVAVDVDDDADVGVLAAAVAVVGSFGVAGSLAPCVCDCVYCVC